MNYRLGVLVFEMQTWDLTVLGLQVSIILASNGCQIYTCFLLSHFHQMLWSPNSKHRIQNIPFSSQNIFFFVRKYYHIGHTKHHCQQNKSAVAMLPCVVCRFETLSKKHLKMHMQNEHDESLKFSCK